MGIADDQSEHSRRLERQASYQQLLEQTAAPGSELVVEIPFPLGAGRLIVLQVPNKDLTQARSFAVQLGQALVREQTPVAILREGWSLGTVDLFEGSFVELDGEPVEDA